MGDENPLKGLESRLQSHAQAFESLLALTPAQEYYGKQVVNGQDPSEQWNRKKQTKEEKRAAKLAKLNPANQKSALDVLQEREVEALNSKRKRENREDDDFSDGNERPAGSKRKKESEDAETIEARRRANVEKRKAKRLHKQQRLQAKWTKLEAKKAAKQNKDLETVAIENGDQEHDDSTNHEAETDAMGDTNSHADFDKLDVSGLADDSDSREVEEESKKSVSDGSVQTTPFDSPPFDAATSHSAASSTSSIIPPSAADEPKDTSQTHTAPPPPTASAKTGMETEQPIAKPQRTSRGDASPKIQLPDIDPEELSRRIRKRIEELRAARKADGPDGMVARSRQELLEQRRKKQEQRKAQKKALRQKAKEDEQREREAKLYGPGSPLGADIFSPRSPQPLENSYAFSRLAFEDGSMTDPSLTNLIDPRKRKGPQDPKTALQAAQAKQSRLAGYDPLKRAEIADKDMWLNAKKRAHGERVRDDTSLLRKALKRKEKAKEKSEREWKDREEAVIKGKEAKQKKRESNLAKRKEEKGGGAKKKGHAKAKGKKKGRPGFEGRFKA